MWHMVGIFFVSNLAHAAYSFCRTVDNRLICTTSPDQVCTYYGPNSVAWNSSNSRAMPDDPVELLSHRDLSLKSIHTNTINKIIHKDDYVFFGSHKWHRVLGKLLY